jgi:hypothetical protein
MAKTRRANKTKRAKRSARLRKTRRGGGPSCYKTDKNGTIIRTWSCTTACGENGDCEPLD